ncbi:ethylene-responsive transcription factor ERF117 isoform X1 [Spatholobus suberectus]|nr:ethylene-responsive transcription factor ERF117 isoform X1 [Spatholobus suberectus]
MQSSRRQSLKERLQSKKGKEKVVPKKEKCKPSKKIRIIYTDPDATDSSSEEDTQTNGSKRRVMEIMFPSMLGNSNAKLYPHKGKRPSSSMYKGVRCRKSRKYGAEIRDPFQKRVCGLVLLILRKRIMNVLILIPPIGFWGSELDWVGSCLSLETVNGLRKDSVDPGDILSVPIADLEAQVIALTS